MNANVRAEDYTHDVSVHRVIAKNAIEYIAVTFRLRLPYSSLPTETRIELAPKLRFWATLRYENTEEFTAHQLAHLFKTAAQLLTAETRPPRKRTKKRT